MKKSKILLYNIVSILLFSAVLSCKMKPKENASVVENYSSTAVLKSILISTVDDKLQYKPVLHFDNEKEEVAIDINDAIEKIWLCFIPEDKNISSIIVNKDNGEEIALSKDSDGFYIKDFTVKKGQINNIYITVKAQDKISEIKYTLKIKIPKENEEIYSALLSSIEHSVIPDGIFSKFNFDSSIQIYDLTVPYKQKGVFIRVKPENIVGIKCVKYKKDSSFFNLNKTSDGQYYLTDEIVLTLPVINLTIISESISGENASYSIRINRQPEVNEMSKNADLKSIEFSENRNGPEWKSVSSFNSNVTDYSITLENSWANIAISSAVSYSNVKSVEMSFDGGNFIRINEKNGFYTNEYVLSAGLHKVRIKVTAEDNFTQKIYTLNITRNEDTIAEYGILLYGCGGGNLDDALILNLSDAAKFGSNKQVKMAAQYKWSKKYQSDPDKEGTFRDVLEGKKWVTKKRDSNMLPLYKAATLTSFINWAAVEIPAKQYILIVWNHGDVWDPYNDSPYPLSLNNNIDDFPLHPQAAIFDDIMGNIGMSTASLAKGIQDSGKPVKTVYFDVCLMLMMETLQELKENAPVVEYVMGAEHLTPGIGGNYELLLRTFGTNDGSTHEEKLTSYVKGTVLNPLWWGQSWVNTPHDLTAVRMNGFENVISKLKDFVDSVDSLPMQTKRKAMLDAFAGRYQGFDIDDDNDNEKSTDLDHFMYLIAGYTGDSGVQNKYTECQKALRDSFVVSEKNKICPLPIVSAGIFVMPYFKNSDDKTVYTKTKFDKAVRWSRLLDLIY